MDTPDAAHRPARSASIPERLKQAREESERLLGILRALEMNGDGAHIHTIGRHISLLQNYTCTLEACLEAGLDGEHLATLLERCAESQKEIESWLLGVARDACQTSTKSKDACGK